MDAEEWAGLAVLGAEVRGAEVQVAVGKKNKVSAVEVRSALKKKSSVKRAKVLRRFFKTGPGEYGEGDVFWGITSKTMSLCAKEYYQDLFFSEILKLLRSRVHEERHTALLVLVNKFAKGSVEEQEEVFNFYLKNTVYINNWDLVDISAYKIVGTYLIDKPKTILYKLAKSKNLWEKRIAIISTFAFIRENKFSETLKISKILLTDEHDLIHKAVGWMLREVGKRSIETEEIFLKRYYKKMPRTMLRYAIEKFPEQKRKSYLLGRI